MSDEFHIKADGSWEFKGEDSRLKDRTRNQVTWRIWNPIAQAFQWQTMDKVYCFDCGADGGYSSRNSPMIRYICQKCWDKGCWNQQFIPMLPMEEHRWRNGLSPLREGD